MTLSGTRRWVLGLGVLALMGTSIPDAHAQHGGQPPKTSDPEVSTTPPAAPAPAGRRGWGWGFNVGALSGAEGGSALQIGFLGEHFQSDAFSFGGILFFTPLSDLTMVAGAVAFRFHVVQDGWEVVPFVGLGFANTNFADQGSTGFYLPLGLEAAVEVSPNIFLTGTFTYNLHRLTYDPPLEDDSASASLTAGIRYAP